LQLNFVLEQTMRYWTVITVVAAAIAAISQADDVPGVRYIPRGVSGSGWATRYWDCCKPSCGWSSNTNGANTARSCFVNGTVITTELQSICHESHGPATACVSQVPFAVSSSLGYAFAAVPAADGGLCGRCFDLEFTGEGKYGTNSNHQAIKGKHLIIMCSNVGSDVQQGQFDIMIPGGGVGIYNGCSGFPNWNYNSGNQYGGLLSDCESLGGENTLQSCLTSKCRDSFGSDNEALSGCLFLADWMHAASNPMHKYREVECPLALKELY